MKIVATSDTHLHEWKLPEKMLELLKSADLIIHAGDFVSYEVYQNFSEFDLLAVSGDSDDEKIISELKEFKKFKVDGFSFGIIHKGNYVNDFQDLIYKALEAKVEVLIFGHIHRFVLEKRKGVVVLCPGSPTEPRMSFASCAEIDVEDEKIIFKQHIVQPVFCKWGDGIEAPYWR